MIKWLKQQHQQHWTSYFPVYGFQLKMLPCPVSRIEISSSQLVIFSTVLAKNKINNSCSVIFNGFLFLTCNLILRILNVSDVILLILMSTLNHGYWLALLHMHCFFLSFFFLSPETEDVNEQKQWIPLHHPQMHCLFHREMLSFWRQSTFQNNKDPILTALIITCISLSTVFLLQYHNTLILTSSSSFHHMEFRAAVCVFVKTHCSWQKLKSSKRFWGITVKWVKLNSSDVTLVNAGGGQPQVWKVKTPERTFYYLPWKFPQDIYYQYLFLFPHSV